MELTDIARFLNTLDQRAFGRHRDKRPAERDRIASPAELGRWLGEHAYAPTAASVTNPEHRLALRLRSGLRDLLDPALGNEEAQAELDSIARTLTLTVHFGDGGPTLAREDTATRSFLADVLATSVRAQADGSWSRLKMCAAEDCRWVFLDTSRNRFGRWCAMGVCGNRVKTRRYRQRTASVA